MLSQVSSCVRIDHVRAHHLGLFLAQIEFRANTKSAPGSSKLHGLLAASNGEDIERHVPAWRISLFSLAAETTDPYRQGLATTSLHKVVGPLDLSSEARFQPSERDRSMRIESKSDVARIPWAR